RVGLVILEQQDRDRNDFHAAGGSGGSGQNNAATVHGLADPRPFAFLDR
nr:hypothetical protein [Tanacetum cinerariifolium]